MRAVVQRVGTASVAVGDEVVGSIGTGLLVLVGVAPEDGRDEVEWLADKIINLRIFPDAGGRMNRSVLDIGGEVLVVSQFTLYGDARKGRRPSFVRAARGAEAEGIYDDVKAAIERQGVACASGRFGAEMSVSLTNEGPVTLLLDSDKQF